MAKQKTVKKILKDNKYLLVHNPSNLGNLIKKGDIMAEQDANVPVTQDANVSVTPATKILYYLYGFVNFVLTMVKSTIVFACGILVGMGILIKNPPADKANIAIIEKLESENTALKDLIKKKNSEEMRIASPEVVQNGFVIPR